MSKSVERQDRTYVWNFWSSLEDNQPAISMHRWTNIYWVSPMLQAVQQWYSELRSSRPRKGEGGRDLNRQLQYSMRNVTAAATGCWGSLWGLQERLPEKLMLTQSLKKQIRVSRAKTAEGNHVQLLWDRENLGHLGSGTFTLVGRSEHGMGVKWQEMRLKEESWQRQKSRASWWIPRFFQPLSPFSFFKNPWKNEILENRANLGIN